jgi:hypothetical protein
MRALRWILLWGVTILPSIGSAQSLENGTFNPLLNPNYDSDNPDGLWKWNYLSDPALSLPIGVEYVAKDFFDNDSDDGVARLSQIYSPVDPDAISSTSYLWQDFDLTTDIQSISCQFKPLINGEGLTETDHFKVYLRKLDKAYPNPWEYNTDFPPSLIAVDQQKYFYHWSTDAPNLSESEPDVNVEKLTGTSDLMGTPFIYYKITVPVSYNGKVRLEFQLESDLRDDITTIDVDNVLLVPKETTYSGVVLTINSPFATGLDGTASVPIHAQLVDDQNNPFEVPGVPVTISVTSPVLPRPWSPSPAPVTTGSGTVDVLASFPPGVYTVTVTVPVPGSQDTLTDTAIFVVYNPAEKGFVTGGGWIVSSLMGQPQRANFGFEAKYQKGVPNGHLEFRFTDGTIDLKSESINYLVVAAPYAWFAGWARAAHGGDGYWFFVTIQDRSKSGSGDSFNIDIWAPGTDLFGPPFLSAGNTLDGGNIVIHSK